MKYAANYSNDIELTDFDEVIIVYDLQNEELITFLNQHPNQKVILSIYDINKYLANNGAELLNSLYEQYNNLSVRFFEVSKFEILNDNLADDLKKLNIPYFFGYVVTNFDQLQYLFTQGISEVYLAEDICFDLVRAKALCKQHGVQIRAFPNVAQASVKQGPALKKFFIRPEDVDIYSDCIDTLEFWGPFNRQAILLKIYKKGRWFGDLQDLLLDFDLSFDSKRIIPSFALMRKNCQRKCMKGDRCEVCDRILNISELLKEKRLIIKPKKND